MFFPLIQKIFANRKSFIVFLHFQIEAKRGKTEPLTPGVFVWWPNITCGTSHTSWIRFSIFVHEYGRNTWNSRLHFVLFFFSPEVSLAQYDFMSDLSELNMNSQTSDISTGIRLAMGTGMCLWDMLYRRSTRPEEEKKKWKGCTVICTWRILSRSAFRRCAEQRKDEQQFGECKAVLLLQKKWW